MTVINFVKIMRMVIRFVENCTFFFFVKLPRSLRKSHSRGFETNSSQNECAYLYYVGGGGFVCVLRSENEYA